MGRIRTTQQARLIRLGILSARFGWIAWTSGIPELQAAGLRGALSFTNPYPLAVAARKRTWNALERRVAQR